MSDDQLTDNATAASSGFTPWLALGAGAVVCMLLIEVAPWLSVYPEDWVIPLTDGITIVTT